jgi:glutamate 5-kinase
MSKMDSSRSKLKDKKRIVVKVGTSSLSFRNGKVNYTRLNQLAMVLADMMSLNYEIVLVSSGAIGVGAGRLKMDSPPTDLVARQALAAIGQVELIRIYERFFDDYNQMIAQVLLTPEGLDDETRYMNAQNTLNQLLSMKILPVVNENDTISTIEIQFGDNDNLSAKVAALIEADLLIILSDVDGFYTEDPAVTPDAEIVNEIIEITPAIIESAGGSGSSFGKGGMSTKLSAAGICREHGIETVIINGNDPQNICRVLEGEKIGTYFSVSKP